MNVEFGDYSALQNGSTELSSKPSIIPPKRVRYLSEIAEASRSYDEWVNEQCTIATQLYQLNGVEQITHSKSNEIFADIKKYLEEQLHVECKKLIDNWTFIKKNILKTFLNIK
jgi:methylmalonyl-CoA mutase